MQSTRSPTRKATLIGLIAIVLWSAIVGLIRGISESLGATGGAAMMYSVASVLLWLYFIPVFSAVLAGLLLHTPLSLAFWKGASMVCAGSILCWLATRARPSKATSAPDNALSQERAGEPEPGTGGRLWPPMLKSAWSLRCLRFAWRRTLWRLGNQ
jgi:hypothetical protein